MYIVSAYTKTKDSKKPVTATVAPLQINQNSIDNVEEPLLLEEEINEGIVKLCFAHLFQRICKV